MNDLFCDFDHIEIFKNPMPILRAGVLFLTYVKIKSLGKPNLTRGEYHLFSFYEIILRRNDELCV